MDGSKILALLVTVILAMVVFGLIRSLLSPRPGVTTLAASLAGLVGAVLIFILAFGWVDNFIERLDTPDLNVASGNHAEATSTVVTPSGNDRGMCTTVVLSRTVAAEATRDECDDVDGTFVANGSAGAGATANVGMGFVSPTQTTVSSQTSTTTQAPAVEPTAAMTNEVPQGGGDQAAPASCEFPAPGNLNDMPKTKIELFQPNTWTHRVFNERLFNAANNWGGADSWLATLAVGSNSGGSWTSHGNPGQIVYRGTDTHITWCLGVLTSSQYMDEFLAGADGPVAINVRIAPNSLVTVTGPSGTQSQATSDAGDITIILPDDGVVTISVDYTTAAPTHESLVWWGPYDRSENINTIDTR